MRADVGSEDRLWFDVDGLSLVPGIPMRQRPTVVLLHGGPGADHTMFKAGAFPSLRRVAQVVYLDQRGHGRSDGSDPGDWNLDVWADDVVRVCDALEITKPVVVGASFGGFVAQRYLARHPGHAGAAVLLGTHSRLDLDVVERAFAARGGPDAGAVARGFFDGTVEAERFYEHCLALYFSTPGVDAGLARSAMDGQKTEILDHFMDEWRTMDLGPGLAAVTCPTLVVSGDLDVISPQESVRDLVAHLDPSCVRQRELVGYGHFEVCGSDVTVAAIAEFVESLS